MNASAIKAVPESFWMLRIMARAAIDGGGGFSERNGRGLVAEVRTKEDDKLSENEVLNRDVGGAVGDGHDERLQVLRLRRRRDETLVKPALERGNYEVGPDVRRRSCRRRRIRSE